MHNVLPTFAPNAHNIQRAGIGYSRELSADQLRRLAPSAFAESAHDSRSARYTYIPTAQIIEGMRNEGFLPVRAMQSGTRDETRADFTKHVIRFRREDQLQAPEAREIILLNSHDGSSAYKLSAGLFRLVCSNGLTVGREDTTQKFRHSGNVLHDIIEGAYSIVKDFDKVAEEVDAMKAVKLERPLMLAFANAAIEARFDSEEKPITAEQALRPRRSADESGDGWTVFNRIQENIIKGGLSGVKLDENGRRHRRITREVKGIDQSDVLNRALWRLGVEVAKLAA